MRMHVAPFPLYLFYAFLSLSSSTGSAANTGCADAAVSGVACERVADPALVRSFANTYRHVGNPVDILTGAKQQREIDYQAVGSLLHLSRYYHSAQVDVNLNLGQGWRHSYQVGLYAIDQQQLRIQQGDGRWIDFSRTENELGLSLFRAELASDGYVLVDERAIWYLPDGRRLTFHGSQLTLIEHSNGSRLELFYRQQRLQSVTDQKGRAIHFEYTESAQPLPNYRDTQAGVFAGHLTGLVLPSGKRIYYRYGGDKNLESVTYSDNESKRYWYENANYPNHLTSIVESDDSISAARRWTYDAGGKVTRFDAADAQSLSIRYTAVANDADLGATIVTYDNGRQERYQWQSTQREQSEKRVEVAVRECGECKEIGFKQPPHQPQTSASVLDNVRNRSVTTVKNAAAKSHYPENHQLDPIKNSLDQSVEISLDGVRHHFYIRVNRLGQVLDISTGNTSLSGLKDKWSEGDIERCDDAPLLERSQFNPPLAKGCLEDLIYLIELEQHLEEMNDKQGLSSSRSRSGTDASNSIGAGCMRNPFQTCAQLERDFELAQLAGCAYAVQLQTCGSQWQAVSPGAIGLDAELFNDGSFASTLFYNVADDEYVLSFRGTDNLGDWKDNLLQASGRSTEQYELAIALATALDKVLIGPSLSFTGHSLGGGLATAAALSIDAPAAVFNAAALHPDTAQQLGLNYENTQRLVSVTTVDGDLLTAIQEPSHDKFQFVERHPAPGVHTVISAPSEQWIQEQKDNASFFSGREGVVLHSINAVLESEEQLLIELCNTTPERA